SYLRLFFPLLRRSPIPTLFPYTTLFRSVILLRAPSAVAVGSANSDRAHIRSALGAFRPTRPRGAGEIADRGHGGRYMQTRREPCVELDEMRQPVMLICTWWRPTRPPRPRRPSSNRRLHPSS